jgi:hypothetical protein
MADTNRAKRRGRPLQGATPGKRHALGFRVTADVKNRLKEATRHSGRSQSQEAEYRLEMSFHDHRDPRLYELLQTIGKTIATIERYYDASIFESRAAHIAAMAVINPLLAQISPEEDAQFEMAKKAHEAKMKAYLAEQEEFKRAYYEQNPAESPRLVDGVFNPDTERPRSPEEWARAVGHFVLRSTQEGKIAELEEALAGGAQKNAPALKGSGG